MARVAEARPHGEIVEDYLRMGGGVRGEVEGVGERWGRGARGEGREQGDSNIGEERRRMGKEGDQCGAVCWARSGEWEGRV